MKENRSNTDKKMNRNFFFALFIFFALTACRKHDPQPVELSWQFIGGASGWIGDFVDYPFGQDTVYELHFEYAPLPEPLDTGKGCLKLTGRNMSDDLFMFAKKQITGLEPLTTYQTSFYIEFASDVPDGMTGIGGSPGESVFIKAGASPIEPQKVPEDNSFYRMNIDKGNQAEGGKDMLVIGDFSNDTDQAVYTLKSATNQSPFDITTDENGSLWLIFGIDSGFEGTTTIYINSIRTELLKL